MKIQPSLKLFFIVVMLVFGLAIAMAFSAITLNYFNEGMDRGVGISMREAAEVKGVEDGKPVIVIGYHVASKWDDLPQKIREAFNNTPPDKAFSLQKVVNDSSLFGPPKDVYLQLKVRNKSQKIRYIAKYINKADMPRKADVHFVIPHIVWIAIFAIFLIGFVLLVVAFIIRKVTKPVESLKNWAKYLDEDKLTQPIPDFQYSELNTLAQIINASLSSVQKSLAREMQFLSYASHELRTPITVVRANTELLIKLYEKEGGTKKQSAVLERIDRAGKSMINLTETLLWLSRDDSNLPSSEKIDLAPLIKQLVIDLNYLLKNKAVNLQVTTEPYIVNAAEVPCRIVLVNLIRNAFQHTLEGNVSIAQVKGKVSIINSSKDKVVDSSDLGFGLGLQLTKKLAARYGWQYNENIETTRYQVDISF